MSRSHIEVKHTVTITTYTPLEHYDGMSAEEAIAYEMDLPIEDRLEFIAESLSCLPDEQIDLGTTAKLGMIE